LDVIKGLKQANVEAQERADEVNKTQEAELTKNCDDLFAIAEQNKANGDECDALKKHLNDEINTTREHLIWIRNRRAEVIRKRQEIHEQRCAGAMLFVKQIKEHREALAVIKLLREDIVGIVREHTGEEVELAQVSSTVEKLRNYQHLFNKEAMKSFVQLSQSAQDVDSEWLEADENAADNNRGALELEAATHNAGERDVANRFIDMIDKLDQHMRDSLDHLKKEEISTAWKVVDWLQESETDLAQLDTDEKAADLYVDKLAITIVATEAKCERLWAIYFESSAAYHASYEARERVRDHYKAEKLRRQEENNILDDCIRIFLDKVSSLDKGLRGKIDDHQDDGQFNSNRIDRRTDDLVQQDAGQVAARVAAEAGFWFWSN